MAESKSARRDYIVLAAMEGEGIYRLVGTYNKLGTGTAVRAAAQHDIDTLGEPARQYVAIPDRNFSIFDAGVLTPEPQLRIKEWDGTPVAATVEPTPEPVEPEPDPEPEAEPEKEKTK